jgi:hypothetical protein
MDARRKPKKPKEAKAPTAKTVSMERVQVQH